MCNQFAHASILVFFSFKTHIFYLLQPKSQTLTHENLSYSSMNNNHDPYLTLSLNFPLPGSEAACWINLPHVSISLIFINLWPVWSAQFFQSILYIHVCRNKDLLARMCRYCNYRIIEILSNPKILIWYNQYIHYITEMMRS